MRKLLVPILTCALSTMGMQARANGAYANTIPYDIYTTSGGVALVTFKGTYNSKPACNTRGTMTVDLNTTWGRAMYAQLLAVQANPKTESSTSGAPAPVGPSIVLVYGTGTCTIIPDSEDLQSLNVDMVGQL